MKMISKEEFFQGLKQADPLSHEYKMACIARFVYLQQTQKYKGVFREQALRIFCPLYKDVLKIEDNDAIKKLEDYAGRNFELYTGIINGKTDYNMTEIRSLSFDEIGTKQTKTVCKMAKKFYSKEIQQAKKEFKEERYEIGI